MGTSENRNQTATVSDARLWFGLLGGGVAWMLHLILAWGIAEFGCVSRFHELQWFGQTAVAWAGLTMSLCMLAMTAIALWVSQRNERQLLIAAVDTSRPSTHPRRFIANSGVLANVVFLFIIVVQSLPFLFYLGNC